MRVRVRVRGCTRSKSWTATTGWCTSWSICEGQGQGQSQGQGQGQGEGEGQGDLGCGVVSNCGQRPGGATIDGDVNIVHEIHEAHDEDAHEARDGKSYDVAVLRVCEELLEQFDGANTRPLRTGA